MYVVLSAVLVATLLNDASTPEAVMERAQPIIPCPSEWKLVHAEYGGEVIQTASLGFTFTQATKNRVWVFAMRKNEVVVHHQWAEYRLKPDAMPAEFDFRDRKGIYTLEGNRLKVCFAAPGELRPKKFQTVDRDNRLLLILEREKR